MPAVTTWWARVISVMGIPLLVGRNFGPQDTETSPKVAVINEIMARQFFPGGSPIGRRFGVGGDPKNSNDIEVVGVVKDAKYESLERNAPAGGIFSLHPACRRTTPI